MSLKITKVRPAAKAGSWYSKQGSKLSTEFDEWLSNSRKVINNNIIKALICPHAGYSHCGATAAYSYHHISPSLIRRVFILGPDHRGAAHNYAGHHPCLLSSATHWETAFGNVSINTQIVEKLTKSGIFSKLSMKDDCNEHCIELIVPFLTYMYKKAHLTAKNSNADTNVNVNQSPNENENLEVKESNANSEVSDDNWLTFEIIPILVGHCSTAQHTAYAELLSEYFMDDSTLFIISSDFCHWGSNYNFTPFDDTKYAANEIYKYITDLDSYGMQTICTLDCDLFWKYLKNTQNTICGRHSICILLRMVNIAMNFVTKDNENNSNRKSSDSKDTKKQLKKYGMQFVDYRQSSKVTDSTDYSVSYAAGVLYIVN